MARRNYGSYAVILLIFGTMGLVYHLSGHTARNETSVSLPVEKRTIADFLGSYQEDPDLIKFIKRQIHPPSTLPYNLPEPNRKDFSQYNQTFAIQQYIGDKKGFFVEVGAYDGVVFSNTLYWERERGWTGLLIEANPVVFADLLGKNRKAYALSACISVTTYVEMMRFHKKGLVGKLLPTNSTAKDSPDDILIPCFPIYSIIAAFGNPTIDLFSLDIEGWEIEALKTIPFDKVNILLFLAEHSNLPKGYPQLTEAMEGFGYETKGKHYTDGIYIKKNEH